MDLNKAMIIGNLTRDPETKTTPNGIAVCTFGIATNLVWTNSAGQKQEKVEFHNIVAWRRLAEICGQYLTKGGKIYLEGRLQTRDWVGQDGVKKTRTEVVASNMIMLGSRMGSAMPTDTNVAKPISTAQNNQNNVVQKQEAVSEPVPSVSTEEPAESIGPSMPVSQPVKSAPVLSEQTDAASVSAPTEDSKEEEDIKVEDIPF